MRDLVQHVTHRREATFGDINRLTVWPARHDNNPVPEKNGIRIGVLQLQGAKPSIIDGFFFAQRIGFSPMEGRVRGQQCPLVTCGQHANLTRSSTPIGVGMVDFQINHKEAVMPSPTTPVQSPKIKLIAGQANIFASLLSVLHLLPPAEQPDTLTMLADFAGELANDLTALVRGAA